jgi:hypothetical protein
LENCLRDDAADAPLTKTQIRNLHDGLSVSSFVPGILYHYSYNAVNGGQA